jgi:hypothetical protein
MKKEMTGLDTAVYYVWCVLTLGTPFFWKIIVKKAISEMSNGK